MMKVRIEVARKAKGITMTKMAEMLNMAPDTYARYEKNPQKLFCGDFLQICKILGKSPFELDIYYRVRDIKNV